MESNVLKRKRMRPIHRWSSVQTKDLLNMILTKISGDSGLFERPTMREFYQSISREVPTIRTIGVDLIYQKMRNLKVSYSAAQSLWEAAADIGQLEEQEIEEQVKRKCPFYELLHKIYKHQPNPTSDRDETSRAATENDENNFVVAGKAEEADEPRSGNDSFENYSDSLLTDLKIDFDGRDSEEKNAPHTFEKILMTEKSFTKRATKHFWIDAQTTALLEAVLNEVKYDSGALRKRSPQLFYEKILKRTSEIPRIDWTVASNKMKHLKVSYLAAGALLKQQTSDARLDDETLNEQIHRVCPFFDMLHQIFGREKSLEIDETSAVMQIKPDLNTDDGNESPHSEDPYPFQDEEEMFKPTEGPKRRRIRTRPNHTWTEKATVKLLTRISDEIRHNPNAFEKPSAREFYSRIRPELNWKVCRTKLSNLRMSYKTAQTVREENRCTDEGSLKKEIYRVCPHFEVLHLIYGGEKFLELDETSTLTKIKSDFNTDDGNESPQSEDPYPFEDEEERFKANEAPKTRRPRTKPNHVWTEKGTKILLTRIWDEVKLDPNAFEKPSARTFYCRIRPELHWKLCRTKMRYLRMSYKTAQTFRDENPCEDNQDEFWLKSQIRKYCPYWDLLHQIFGPQLSNSDEVQFLIGLKSDNDDDDDDVDVASAPPSLNYSPTPDVLALVPSIQRSKQVELTIETLQSPKQSKSSPPRVWSLQKEKLKLEREKIVNDLKIRQLELQHQFDIRKLKVERDERLALAKMKLEMEERVKKYELDLKLKNNSYLNL